MPTALAIFAHPDDIEFVAAGTLLLIKDLGWNIHYFNIANGCCGSNQTDRKKTAEIRGLESQRSAALLDATYYPPICDDLDIFYNAANFAKVAAVVRHANPSVVLTHAAVDYMEDHMETCRLAVSAAFAKGNPNFVSDPIVPNCEGDVAIYHAQPHGNRTPMDALVHPERVVPIDAVMDRKIAMLQCHQSQQQWLMTTQKMNSYVQTMLDLNEEVAKLGNLDCRYAEGWQKHLHLGFASRDFDPLGPLFAK